MYKLPLFTLLCSSESCTSPKEHSWNTMEHHCPRRNITDHGRRVIDHWYGSRPQIFGRSAIEMVGRPCMPAESCFASSRGQPWHGNAFQANVGTTTLLIMFMTQRSLGLAPRATNRAFQCVMAKAAKVCNLMSNVMHTKQTRDPTTVMVIQEARHACKMTPRHVT